MGKNKKTQKKIKRRQSWKKKHVKQTQKKNEKNICGLSPHILEYY